MTILIIEDDENKLNDIIRVIKDICRRLSIMSDITVKHSYQSGLEAVIDNEYTLLLLDMSLPNFEKKSDSGIPFGRAGEIILNEIQYYDKRTKTIIVTQYEDIDGSSMNGIDQELKNEFSSFYYGYVKYTANESNWENELETKIMETLA